MKNVNEISEMRMCGFYELKRLLGLGDDRLSMILTVGGLKPISFTNSEKKRKDELYPLFAVKEAMIRLQGTDVELEYKQQQEFNALPEETKKKIHSVMERINRKYRKTANR